MSNKNDKLYQKISNIYNRDYEENEGNIIEYNIKDLLNLIDDFDKREKILKLYDMCEVSLKTLPASVKYHQKVNHVYY